MPSEHRPPRSRQEERRDETKAELVAAAATVFARRGFGAAGVEEIAAEAGYSTGAIYHHFSGKDELFLAVFEEYARTRVREFEEIQAQSTGDLPQRARAFADHWMDRVVRDPEFIVLTLEFIVYAWRNPQLRKGFAHSMAAVRIALARIFGEELGQSRISETLSVDDVATALRELGVGLGWAKLVDPEAVPNSLFGDFVEDYFERLLQSALAASRG